VSPRVSATKTPDFKDIEWGPDDARGDRRLAEYFVEIPEYQRVIAGSKRYIIGRKGTGKTAVLERIRIDSKSQRDWFISMLSLRGFPITGIRELRLRNCRGKSQFVPVWMFLIASELARQVIRDPDAGPENIVSELRLFVESNFPGLDDGISGILEKLQSNGGQVSASVAWIENARHGDGGVTRLVHYNKIVTALLNRLRRVSCGSYYFVLMDELDEGYKVSDSGLRLILLSLLRATEDLSIALQDAAAKYRPVIALRSDIFDSLDDNDLNKLDDSILRLAWSNVPGRNTLPLRQVVDARIRASVGCDWDAVVASGSQGLPRGVDSIWRYMTARTHDRPRDVVKFLKLCTNDMRSSGKLTSGTVIEAESAYSQWLYNEIGNEIQSFLPFWRETFQCLASVDRAIMKAADLRRALLDNRQVSKSCSEGVWSPEQIMETLFGFGVIGNLTPGGVWLFKYKDGDLQWRPKLEIITHWGLNKKLRILRGLDESGSFHEAGEAAAPRREKAVNSLAPIEQNTTARTPRSAPLPAITHPSLPLPLINARKSGRLIPFIGAGLSLGPDVQGDFPSWPDLPARLLEACDEALVWADDRDRTTMRDRFLVPDSHTPDIFAPRSMPLQEMLRQLDQLRDKLGHDYSKALSDIFRPQHAAPGAAHHAVIALEAQIVLTTNLDELIEAAEGPPARQVYTGIEAADALRDIQSGKKVLFKVHGSAKHPKSVVLTLEEYRRAHADPSYRKTLNHLLIERNFLFLGYGMQDPNDLDVILADNASELGGATGLHFALLKRLADPQSETDRRDRLRRTYRVAVIPYDDHGVLVPFLEALMRA
jgi:hypothetical protein